MPHRSVKALKRWWPEALVVVGAYLFADAFSGILLAVGALAIFNRLGKRLIAIENRLHQISESADGIETRLEWISGTADGVASNFEEREQIDPRKAAADKAYADAYFTCLAAGGTKHEAYLAARKTVK